MKIKKSQLRRIIREALQEAGKGWMDSHGICDTHNIDRYEAGGAFYRLEEFGYSLGLPPSHEINQKALDSALAAYPGEFTLDDYTCAVQVMRKR